QTSSGQEITPEVTAAEWTDEPIGFAALPGEGLDGTTGGAAGETVTVTTQEELAEYAEAEEPYTILVEGTIEMDAFGETIDVASVRGTGRRHGARGRSDRHRDNTGGAGRVRRGGGAVHHPGGRHHRDGSVRGDDRCHLGQIHHRRGRGRRDLRGRIPHPRAEQRDHP